MYIDAILLTFRYQMKIWNNNLFYVTFKLNNCTNTLLSLLMTRNCFYFAQAQHVLTSLVGLELRDI